MKWSYVNVGVCFSFVVLYLNAHILCLTPWSRKFWNLVRPWRWYLEILIIYIHKWLAVSIFMHIYPQNKTKSKQNKNKQNSWFQFFISWIKISVNISSRCLGDAVIRIVISKVELVGLNMIVWTIHCNLLQSSLKSTRREVTFFFWAQIAPCWCFVLH